MVSNLLKEWRDDFATVKRQRDGFGAYRKETGCHPASLQALHLLKPKQKKKSELRPHRQP
jgi:hypothetical protein